MKLCLERMIGLIFSFFSEKEYAARLERARELMITMKLDALFISGEENYTYFTGAKSLTPWQSFTRPVLTLIPLEDEPVIITHTVLLEDTQKTSNTRDVRAYSSETVPLGTAPVDLLVEIFKERRLSEGVVGAELGYEQRLGLPYDDFIKLKNRLSNVRFVDASPLLWRLRITKSPQEVSCIRRACTITGTARQRCFSEVKAGMTEREVANLFFRHMLEEGAERPGFAHIVSGNLSESTLRPTDKPLKKGETVYLDGGCYVHDYTCDFCRIATVGEPSSTQTKLHRILCGINSEMMELFVPGTKTSEIARVCRKELGKRGFQIESSGRVGHGQGMLITEPPSISELDETILEPGMVVSSEPHLTIRDGFFTWEDVIAIVEDGYEILTENETSDLITIK